MGGSAEGWWRRGWVTDLVWGFLSRRVALAEFHFLAGVPAFVAVAVVRMVCWC